MATTIKEFARLAAEKTQSLQEQLRVNKPLRRVIYSCHPKLRYAAFLLNEASETDESGKHSSVVYAFERGLQDAVEQFPPTEEDYAIARELQAAFTSVNPLKPEKRIRKNSDGLFEGQFEVSESALHIPPSEFGRSEDMVIDRFGNLLITRGVDSRAIRPVEVLQHGQEIIAAIDPARIARLQALIDRADQLNWDKYIPAGSLEHLNGLPFYQ